MRQLVFEGAGVLRWQDVPSPRLDSDAAALVRPVAVATCDLDALIIAGRSPFAPPFALGHEGVGKVIEVGNDVTGFEPGQLVSVPFQISCGECVACRRGRTASCRQVPRASTYGFGPQVSTWGGFLSDVVLVPFADHMLVALPEGVAPAAAASASDNIPDGWRAVAPALAADPGAHVLVVGGQGPGSIGLYAVAVARALGSERVVYVDGDARRAAVAEALGAEILSGPWPRRLGPFPITVDACGTSEGLHLALRSTAPDGQCTSTALYLGDQPRLPLLEMYEKVITFKTGRTHARANMPEVLALIQDGSLVPETVTTAVVDWEQAAGALAQRDWVKLVIQRDADA